MRILQICPDFPPFVRGGGSETFNLLAESWRKNGHQVTVITSAPSRAVHTFGGDLSSFEAEYFRLTDLPSSFHEITYFLPLKILETIRLSRFLRRQLLHTDVIIIHGILESISFLSILLARKHAGKLILTQHGISTAESVSLFRIMSKVLYKTLGKIALSNVRNIVVYCRRTKEEFAAYFGDTRRFSVTETPLGVDVQSLKIHFQTVVERREDFEKWAEAIGISTDNFLFAIGRNVGTKGFDVLIRSFAAVSQEYRSLKLLIAGDQTEYTHKMHDLANELGIQERITFSGRLSEEQKVFLMTRCTCFVIPSRKEGYGLNAVEAAIFGVPCVATDTGAHAEILSRNPSAVIVDPGNSQALASGLSTILRSEHQKATFDAGVAAKYDIESLARIYTQLVDRLGLP